MRLTRFSDYALRVLLYLGLEPERRVTIHEVAEAFRISENHVSKVVHFLGAAGWLENVRGRGGGVRLAVPPSLIRLGEVVRLAEGSDVPAECFEARDRGCAIERGCGLKGVFVEAVGSFYATLDRYTLADLLGGGEREVRFRMRIIPEAAPPSEPQLLHET